MPSLPPACDRMFPCGLSSPIPRPISSSSASSAARSTSLSSSSCSNALLELEGDHRIVDLEYLSPEQHVPVEELKQSRCRRQVPRPERPALRGRDAGAQGRGIREAGGLQHLQGLRRPTARRRGLPRSRRRGGSDDLRFPALAGPPVPGGAPVPMLSRWRMQEQHGAASACPRCSTSSWSCRNTAPATISAGNDRPLGLLLPRGEEPRGGAAGPVAGAPYREALEVARMAGFERRGARPLRPRQDRRAGRPRRPQPGRNGWAAKKDCAKASKGVAQGSATKGCAEAIRALCQAFEITRSTRDGRSCSGRHGRR